MAFQPAPPSSRRAIEGGNLSTLGIVLRRASEIAHSWDRIAKAQPSTEKLQVINDPRAKARNAP